MRVSDGEIILTILSKQMSKKEFIKVVFWAGVTACIAIVIILKGMDD